ncbi:MAG: hypothetical protein AAB835_02575 [Patescibacteria group bacterium]
MKLLKNLVNDTGIPKSQRKAFNADVKALLREGGKGVSGALFCLGRLGYCYSVGGISCGRSMRSLILDQSMFWLLGVNETPERSSVRKARTAISILVAMHYDYGYINKSRWFDFELKAIGDIPLQDRELVSAAALALGINKIPEKSKWPLDRILVFIRDF